MKSSLRWVAVLLLLAGMFFGHGEALALNRWTNTGSGNWSSASNWSEGVPGQLGDAYISNGGTALITTDLLGPRRVYLGGAAPGSIEHMSGSWTGGTAVLFVAPSAPGGAAVSKFKFGGTATAELQTVGGPNQLIEQSGGTLQMVSLGIDGDYTMTGGDLLVTYEFGINPGGFFHLIDGEVTLPNDRVTMSGDYLQTGGTFTAAIESTIRYDGLVRIQGGLADFRNTTLLPSSRVELSGGTLKLGKLTIQKATGQYSAGELEVNGGTLELTNGVMSGSAPLTFKAGAWTLDARGGIANVASSSMADVSQAHLLSANETLTILPQGVTPANFASSTINGVVHTAGSVLTLPMGKTVRGMGTIDDPLVVAGQLIAFDSTPSSSANPAILVNNGIRVLENAVAKLGNGRVTIADQTSGLFGGELRADELFIGQPGRPGRFTMTGGVFGDGNTTTSSPKFYIGHAAGTVGEVLMSGGLLEAEELLVGVNGQGKFTQTGGEIALRFSTGSAPVIGRGGHYQLQGGRLRSPELEVTGTFTQTGGEHQTDTSADVGIQASEGLFELLGGSHTVSHLSIGRHRDSKGRYRVDDTGELVANGLSMIGEGHGILEIDGGKVTIATANIGQYGPGYELWLQSADANVSFTNKLTLGPSASLSVVPNAAIKLGGDLNITSVDPTKLSDLTNLKVVIANLPGRRSVVEVAGQDLGMSQEGFADNFALQTLQIGDGTPGVVRLDDLFDNQLPSAGKEALYVRNLIVGPSSTLDLNGYKVYYTTLEVSPTANVLMNGGMLIHVPIPEPKGVSLAVAFIICACLCRRSCN